MTNRAGVLREALVDVDAITHNTRRIARVTGVDVIAVIKADAYGHGAERSAVAALEGGARLLGVSDVSEAVALRRAGITAPVLAWLHSRTTSFVEAVALGVEIGVSSYDELQRVAAAAEGARTAAVHLKIDTGLSRNGIPHDDRALVLAEAARLERIGRIRVAGLFSHLSNTSPEDDRAALESFREGELAAAHVGLHPPLRHIAATQAALSLPETRLNAVRIGLGLYGLSPFEDRSAADLGLRPAMTLRAPVVAVRRVRAGAGVSYGYDFRAPRDTTLALVPAGYADGVPRAASGRGAEVSIGGRRFPVAGRIAMDQLVVDTGDEPVSVGDEAIVFGDPTLGVPSAEDWARAAGTINYEIVTRIGPRVPRRTVRS